MQLGINPTALADDAIYLDLVGLLVLGSESTGKLRETLKAYIDDEYRSIVISLAGVTKMDAAGIGVLVGAYAYGLDRGSRVELCNMSSRVLELLAICKLLGVFGPESFRKIAA